MKAPVVLFLALGILAAGLSAQDSVQIGDTIPGEALKVYITFDDDDFSTDFLKKEIPVIMHVRDQVDADVYILATSQKTGAGGYEYSFFLTGQYGFTGMVDTVKYISSPDDTLDKTREGQIAMLKMGLMRYIIRTPLSENVEISFTDHVREVRSEDPWNYWIIRLFLGGTLRGEKTTKYSNLWGGFNAGKVTEEWKIELSADMGNTVEKFALDSGELVSKNRVLISDMLAVKSIGEHWSLGVKAHIGSFTYSNYRLKYFLFPGIEYDIFPYSESTRKQVRILYSAGYIYHNYRDTTIYNQMSEHLWGHRLDIAAEVVQKWGSLEATLGWKNYLHDWSKNNLAFKGSMNLRVARGLQLRFSAGASMIHNQLSLPKGGASTEDILLRQKELATQYSYFTDITIFYTFGSIYNDIVNPRFDDLNRW